MKRLFLHVTGYYPRSYQNCGYWSDEEVWKLPVVNSLDYDQIILCGGEPITCRYETRDLAKSLRNVLNAMGKKDTKIYLQTHSCDFNESDEIVRYCDGMILIPLDIDQMRYFRQLNKHFLDTQYRGKKDLVLNIKPELTGFLPENMKLWRVVFQDSYDIETDRCRIYKLF